MPSWRSIPIHVLDFEGTRRSGVVEFGVATLVNGQILSTHTRLCAPAGPVAASESAVHGLAETDIANAAPFTADQHLFAALRQTGPFAAHHVPVERALLRRVWPIPPAAPDFGAVDPAAAPRLANWGPWLDTRRICENLYPKLSTYHLMDLIAAFELQKELAALASQHCPAKRRRAHCALYDALAAALLLTRLGREPQIAALPLAWLLAHSVPSDAAETFRQGEIALGD